VIILELPTTNTPNLVKITFRAPSIAHFIKKTSKSIKRRVPNFHRYNQCAM
jgi:hypothetical protein